MKKIFHIFKKDYKEKRVHTFATIGTFKDFIWGTSKIVLSIIGSSFFIGLNALFSFCLGTVRLICIKNRNSNLDRQKKIFRTAGILVCVCSLIYIAYSIRLFFVEEDVRYSMILGIAIAAFTFFEFGFNIYDLVKYRNKFTPTTKAVKMVGFCSTLTCFVLTQIALTSLSEMNMGVWNGAFGVCIGLVCLAIGLYMSLKRFPNSEIEIQQS